MRDEWPAWTSTKQVTIISLAAVREESLQLSEKCVARAVSPVRNIFDRVGYVLSGLARFPVAAELWNLIRQGPAGFLTRLRTLAVHLQGAERYRRGLIRVIRELSLAGDDSLVLYSYWFGAGTHAVINASRSCAGPRSIAVTRMHGTDLYEYANPAHYLPFRRRLARDVDAMYAISQHGADYAMRHWCGSPEKIRVSRLGTRDHFLGRFPIREQTFTVLSCSYINHLKRVDMIAAAIFRLCGHRVHWIHIGGGSDELQLRNECERLFQDREHLTFELRGNLPHEQTVALLQQTNINVLVNASKSEGIPVSMMEAHCLGIPVVGPNVGGISEIIESGINGCLLEPPLTSTVLAAAVQGLIDMPTVDYERLCRQARSSWERKFSAETNYRAFAASVAKLLPQT